MPPQKNIIAAIRSEKKAHYFLLCTIATIFDAENCAALWAPGINRQRDEAGKLIEPERLFGR